MVFDRVFGHAVGVGGLGWMWYAKRGKQGRLSVGFIGVFVAENHYMPPKSIAANPPDTRDQSSEVCLREVKEGTRYQVPVVKSQALFKVEVWRLWLRYGQTTFGLPGLF